MTWEDRFRAALVEVDPTKLLALIHDAELAISARSASLPTISNEELQAIGDATCVLRILRSQAPTVSIPAGNI